MALTEKIWGMTTNIGPMGVGHVRVAIEVVQESDRSRQTIADFIIPRVERLTQSHTLI